MINSALLNSLLIAFIAGLLCLPILFKKNKKAYLLIIFLSVVFLYNFIVRMGTLFNPSTWAFNWWGYILAALFTLIVIASLKWKNKNLNFGLTFKQKKGSLKPVLIVFVLFTIGQIAFVYFLFGKTDPTLENYLFQLTMPGITEELIYRGLFLGVLNKIFTERKTILGAPMGYGSIIVTILFTLAHGISINTAFNISLQWLPMIGPFLFAVVVVWIRERTGSILIPILAHNFSNELILVIKNLK